MRRVAVPLLALVLAAGCDRRPGPAPSEKADAPHVNPDGSENGPVPREVTPAESRPVVPAPAPGGQPGLDGTELGPAPRVVPEAP